MLLARVASLAWAGVPATRRVAQALPVRPPTGQAATQLGDTRVEPARVAPPKRQLEVLLQVLAAVAHRAHRVRVHAVRRVMALPAAS